MVLACHGCRLVLYWTLLVALVGLDDPVRWCSQRPVVTSRRPSNRRFHFFGQKVAVRSNLQNSFFFLQVFPTVAQLTVKPILTVRQWKFILISWFWLFSSTVDWFRQSVGFFFISKFPKRESSRLPRLSKKLKNSQILTVFVNCRLVSTVKTKKTGFFWRRLSTVDSP